MTTKPVWIWLPGQTDPVRAGSFDRTTGHQVPVGAFSYDQDYLAMDQRMQLDQGQLSKFRGTVRTTDYGGLFGILRDVKPEGFGLDTLHRKYEVSSLDDLDALELSAGDSVGALEVCEDIDSKQAYRPHSAETMFDVMQALSPAESNAHVVTEMEGLQGTSLGGERPKITVLHEGQQWIAKFAGSRDDPMSTLREYLAMKLARLCQIDAAPVQYVNKNGRGTILVKRFDRDIDQDGRLTRSHFASAATVLGANASKAGDKGRTYPNLATQALRWGVVGHKPELWRRIAFKVLVGNGDDHPRNHGFLRGLDGWRLSPAYDIAPYSPNGGKAVDVKALSMGILPNGNAGADARTLLLASKLFDLSYEDANSYLETTFAAIHDQWDTLAREVGQNPLQKPLFELPALAERPSPEEVAKYRYSAHRR